MHELSIAAALLEQVRRHTPAGQRVTIARIEAGALQGIDPDALQFAWQSLTAGTAEARAQLELKVHSFKVSCRECGRRFESADMFAPCVCGSVNTAPEGSDELRLIALDVEALSPPPEPGPS